MVTLTKEESGKLTVDFNSTMFFQELMLCPSDKRQELMDRIIEHDSEWLFRFCVDNFGNKIFFVKEGK